MSARRRALAELARRQQRMRLILGACAVVGIIVGAGLVYATVTAPKPSAGHCPWTANNHCAVITMASGVIVFEIEEAKVPRTASQFSALMTAGYYNGLPWHRVEDFVIQTGDGPPQSTIPLETRPDLTHVRGAVGVARTSDPNSGSSQFYILKKDSPHLDAANSPPGYTVFGEVRIGMDVVDKVAQGDLIQTIQVVESYSS